MLRHVFIWSVSKQRIVSITTHVSPRLDLRCFGRKIYLFWKDSFKFSCVKSASVYNPTVRSASASNTWLFHATLRFVCLCMCGACTMCVDIYDVCACVVMCIHICGNGGKEGLLVLSSPGTQQGYTIIFYLIPLGQDLPLSLSQAEASKPGQSSCPSLTPHPVLGL